MENSKKNIKIVSGNGKELDISDVSTHISALKPKTKSNIEKGKQIVIPKVEFNSEDDDNSEKKETKKN